VSYKEGEWDLKKSVFGAVDTSLGINLNTLLTLFLR
jgi:hypothetical protein